MSIVTNWMLRRNDAEPGSAGFSPDIVPSGKLTGRFPPDPDRSSRILPIPRYIGKTKSTPEGVPVRKAE